jgi:NTE family protein
VRIGVALGGGFARAIAHLGVLRVLERAGIQISAIGGISAGAVVAAAYASGRNLDEIAAAADGMQSSEVLRWPPGGGQRGSRLFRGFLDTLLRSHRFEDMQIPLAVVATDVMTGTATVFRDRGDVIHPIRASCAYPGLLEPVTIHGRLYVDGAIGMEVPSAPVRDLHVDKVIAIRLLSTSGRPPTNSFEVVNRCFRIMSARAQSAWRSRSDLVIEPEVSRFDWNGFGSARQLIAAGEQAAVGALSAIQEWFEKPAAPAGTTNGQRHPLVLQSQPTSDRCIQKRSVPQRRSRCD